MTEIKIGEVLKRLLREHRKNLKTVSRDTGIPYSTLHTWHENRQPKDIVKARDLAAYFRISLHELLFDKPDTWTQRDTEMPRQSANNEFLRGRFEVIVRKIE